MTRLTLLNILNAIILGLMIVLGSIAAVYALLALFSWSWAGFVFFLLLGAVVALVVVTYVTRGWFWLLAAILVFVFVFAFGGWDYVTAGVDWIASGFTSTPRSPQQSEMPRPVNGVCEVHDGLNALGLDGNGFCAYDQALVVYPLPGSPAIEEPSLTTTCPVSYMGTTYNVPKGTAGLVVNVSGANHTLYTNDTCTSSSVDTPIEPVTDTGGMPGGAITTINGGFQLDPLAGLKYQFDQGCPATTAPMEFPACILQEVQAGRMTGEQAVVAIQQLAAKYHTPTFEGMELSFPNTQAVGAWCPGGVSYYPPDTAKPLVGTTGSQWADTLFVVDKATGGPDRKIITAKGSPCWIYYRQ